MTHKSHQYDNFTARENNQVQLLFFFLQECEVLVWCLEIEKNAANAKYCGT